MWEEEKYHSIKTKAATNDHFNGQLICGLFSPLIVQLFGL